jgi:hypothetical protein
VARLAALAGLLLLFPIAALVLRSSGPPPPRPTAFSLAGWLSSRPGPEGSTEYVVGLELRGRARAAWRVDQVFLTLLDGQLPVSTLIEDAPALAARHRGGLTIPPGGSATLGPFVITVPAGAGGEVLLASVRLTEPETGGSVTAQTELPLNPAAPAAEPLR